MQVASIFGFQQLGRSRGKTDMQIKLERKFDWILNNSTDERRTREEGMEWWLDYLPHRLVMLRILIPWSHGDQMVSTLLQLLLHSFLLSLLSHTHSESSFPRCLMFNFANSAIRISYREKSLNYWLALHPPPPHELIVKVMLLLPAKIKAFSVFPGSLFPPPSHFHPPAHHHCHPADDDASIMSGKSIRGLRAWTSAREREKSGNQCVFADMHTRVCVNPFCGYYSVFTPSFHPYSDCLNVCRVCLLCWKQDISISDG